MLDNKVLCMKEAKKYSKNYWDGDRKFGYGGYKYIPGRWVNVANKIIKKYKLNNSSKILDIGCGKGFLLYEIKKILPGITLYGVDISKYALKSINKLISGYKPRDNYSISWNGTDDGGRFVPAGIYFYTMKTEKQMITKKMVLLK